MQPDFQVTLIGVSIIDKARAIAEVKAQAEIRRILGWDEAPKLVAAVSDIDRLSAEDRARSVVTPGQPAGISRILYQFENEMLGEIVNRTVHCFWLIAAERTANGYVLWFAVYVRKLKWFTPVYMALISSALKWIIYPAVMNGVRRRWAQAFPAGASYQQARDSDAGKVVG